MRALLDLVDGIQTIEQGIRDIANQVRTRFYGKGFSVPALSPTSTVPLYWLQPDLTLQSEELVKIKGVRIDGELTLELPYEVWQELKLASWENLRPVCMQLRSRLERHLNMNHHLAKYLDQLEDLQSTTRDQWHTLSPRDYLQVEYTTADPDLLLERRTDYMTLKIETPNSSERKFKFFQSDFFFNVQVMISQAWNSSEFGESMYHLQRLASYVLNGIIARTGDGRFLVVSPRDPEPLLNFIDLVDLSAPAKRHLDWHQYYTAEERLALATTYSRAHATLQFVSGKLFSLASYIIARNPQKKSNGFGFKEMSW